MIIDIDILEIDSKIIRNFEDNKSKINTYEEKKSELQNS